MFQLFSILVFFSNLASIFLQNQKFDDLKFIFTKGNTTSDFVYVGLNETEKLLNHVDYNNDRPTMLYGYGYTESYGSLSTQTIVSSYIARNDHNILVVEWSNYTSGNYILETIPNAHKVGRLIGQALLRMRDQGFALEKFHLVGHSLGGHLVGFIGRSVTLQGNFKISRITALDPAGPFFTGIAARFTDPLRKTDAIFVDVIHTDSNFFGSSAESGTSDFWPNAGRDQPACPPATPDIDDETNFCSHRRSWAYFTESVRSFNKTFESVSCSSWQNFTAGECDHMRINFMGIDADPSQTGNFYLQTNAMEPFNRGQNGTMFSNESSQSL